MKISAGACLRASSNILRTRLAPTPTKTSMNSDPDVEKKGTSASPAKARASRVLPVPGGPMSSTPCGTSGTELLKAIRISQELDKFRDLAFGLILTRHIGEGGIGDPLHWLGGPPAHQITQTARRSCTKATTQTPAHHSATEPDSRRQAATAMAGRKPISRARAALSR